VQSTAREFRESQFAGAGDRRPEGDRRRQHRAAAHDHAASARDGIAHQLIGGVGEHRQRGGQARDLKTREPAGAGSRGTDGRAVDGTAANRCAGGRQAPGHRGQPVGLQRPVDGRFRIQVSDRRVPSAGRVEPDHAVVRR